MKLSGLVIAACALLGFGCGKDSSSPSPAAGPAGVVVEVTGEVTASRDGADPRPLAVDAQVFADDTIKTGPDSSVGVVLEHNKAALRLEANMSRRVDQSLAWKAPRREDDSVLDRGVDDRTAAAGRHTEREAAGTATTAIANTQPPTGEPPAKGEEARATAAPEPRAAASRDTAASESPPRSAPKPKAKKRSPPPPPPPPPAPTPTPKAESASIGTAGAPGGGGSASGGGSKGRGTSASDRAVAKTRGVPDVEKLVSGRIKVCHALDDDAPAGTITAVVKVSAAGIAVVSIKASGGDLSAVSACARKKIAALSVSGAKPGTYRVTVALK